MATRSFRSATFTPASHQPLAGAYEVSGTTLYVNRGFGTSRPPVRLGSPPEVTRIVLIAA